MDIGKKLRQARLDAGLSQRQLCGDVITRNMLSLIENGSARPSMDTLAYLAEQLGKPMGFFLGEKSANAECIKKARQAYIQGQYADGDAILKGYKPMNLTNHEIIKYQQMFRFCSKWPRRHWIAPRMPGNC